MSENDHEVADLGTLKVGGINILRSRTPGRRPVLWGEVRLRISRVVRRPLSVSHPELAAEATGWDPATVSFGSTKKMLWRCAAGHEWWATVNNRSTGTGCPFCAGFRVIAGVTDLATTHPHLAKEALGWDARSVSAGSHRRVWWRCKEDHEWQALVSQRAKVTGSGCPICANQKVLVGYNDLATSNPYLASQACGWNPATVTAGSNKKVRWRCEKGHEWVTTPNKRSSGRGCPFCAGNQVLAGFNDLVTMHPALACEVVVGNPAEVSAGSNKKLRWRCDKGHEWDASAKDRSKGSGCPICAGKQVLQGFNDLMTTNPSLAAEAAGWDPRTISAGSGKKLQWRCAVGHEWVVDVASRVRGRGCPICAGQRVLAGFNDLATLHPDLATQAVGWDPTTVRPGSGQKLPWRCALGHVWSATVNDRVVGTDCPYCTGRRALAGFNDLATTHPELAAEAHGWDPTTRSAGSDRRLRWRCAVCHHAWWSTVENRVKGSGCPSCADYGYNPSKPAWIYFLRHPRWDLSQIGITNVPDLRLGQHKRRGWVVRELMGPMDGSLARELESGILTMLRIRGAEVAPGHVAGRFDGYTESWIEESFPASTLRELLELVPFATTP